MKVTGDHMFGIPLKGSADAKMPLRLRLTPAKVRPHSPEVPVFFFFERSFLKLVWCLFLSVSRLTCLVEEERLPSTTDNEHYWHMYCTAAIIEQHALAGPCLFCVCVANTQSAAGDEKMVWKPGIASLRCLRADGPSRPRYLLGEICWPECARMMSKPTVFSTAGGWIRSEEYDAHDDDIFSLLFHLNTASLLSLPSFSWVPTIVQVWLLPVVTPMIRAGVETRGHFCELPQIEFEGPNLTLDRGLCRRGAKRDGSVVRQIFLCLSFRASVAIWKPSPDICMAHEEAYSVLFVVASAVGSRSEVICNASSDLMESRKGQQLIDRLSGSAK